MDSVVMNFAHDPRGALGMKPLATLLAALAVAAVSAKAAADVPGNTPPAGDPQRGRAIVADRQLGLCLLCHRAPIPEERWQGDVGPDLAGVGQRFTRDELRARLVDPARFNPATVMPAFLRRDGLWRVPAALRGQSLLSPAQVDDVVAYLATLK